MTRSLPFGFRRVSLLCAVVAAACVGIASSSSVPTTQQYQPRSDDVAAAGGLGAALWTVLDSCFRVADQAEPVAVCLKSKALTALDRALDRPTVSVYDGVSLTARDRKSVVNPLSADRAALQAAADPKHRNALLDALLAERVEEFASTRTVVLMNGSAEQEGRGGKKEPKVFRMALALAGLLILTAAGSVMFKSIALTAITALMASKFAIGLYTVLTLGKTLQDYQHNRHGKPAPEYFDRIMQVDDHNTAAATAYHSVA